jgi:hypothetical protein
MLTWALLALTFLLFAKEAIEAYENDYLPYHHDEKANQEKQINKNSNSIGAVGGISTTPAADPGNGPG